MKKIILLAIVFGSCTCLPLFAQDDVTAEQVVAKYVQVCADKGYIDTIRTVRIVAKAVVESDTITMLILKDAGRAYYVKITTPNGEQVRIYNQGAAVIIAGASKQDITDKAELDEMKLQSHILPDMVYKKLGYKMTMEGMSKLDGVEYYVVRLESPNGYVKTNYYEKESGLLRIIKDQNGITSILEQYVKFKGGLYPKRNVLTFPDGGSLEVILAEISNNEPIDPALFNF